jgi:sterol desaturase/sphingolipid hydroxylase (fatty acid hydroxylase superfamily)
MVGDPPFELPDVVTLAIPGFVGLIVAEMIVARRSGKGGYDAADTAASLAMGLGNSVAKLAFGGLAVSAYWVVFNWRLYDIPWAWWSVPACFFGEDLAYYWFHRISHERRWFWASHVVHHTSQHYNLSTALRQTWTGVLGLTFVFWLPLVFIGFPPSMVFFFSSVSLVYQFWIHTETIGRLGPLEWIFNTPSHHRVHHATNPRYLDANYAGVLIIWDRLFGTFVAEDLSERPRYGVIANLGTFNPLRVAAHEWVAIARDVAGAPSIAAAVMFVFGPPGWSPDGSRKTTRSIKAQWRAPEPAGAAATRP